MLFFVICYLISPHGKCHLNPQVREASDGMMEFLALTSLHGKLPFIPLAFADTAASHLIEGSSSRLVASPSEAETDTSARTVYILQDASSFCHGIKHAISPQWLHRDQNVTLGFSCFLLTTLQRHPIMKPDIDCEWVCSRTCRWLVPLVLYVKRRVSCKHFTCQRKS